MFWFSQKKEQVSKERIKILPFETDMVVFSKKLPYIIGVSSKNLDLPPFIQLGTLLAKYRGVHKKTTP
ncbi:hypothetical protein [Intestinimonas timonensis]|uniref:hypothetical protein n=1 Tax=Intestinimonas timonensis TaxID=1689270 RepID=UPI003A924C73